MKLGKRLLRISELVSNDYTHIWDCCCDHGLLGARLLDQNLDAKIHFVDIVTHLIEELDKKLDTFYKHKSEKWQTHCLDVAKLPLAKYPGRHLVIIAGVGGDLCSDFVQKITRQHPHLTIDFILCPVHHLFTLRKSLNTLKLSLKNELLISENKRIYELIYVSSIEEEKAAVSPIGEHIWHYRDDLERKIAEQYLNKTISHYTRISQGNTDVSDILSAYQQVTLKSTR
ncbi:hypothetical protein N474_11930 [Pseudoalteromonas luteoviolacea CPMOR-2]|uniref:tRNA (adenine(22)-N(1))-methyltransferase TrmK n=1 Tax=Pseudoalteromonas luteoviolacea TaxID=43657 RepID=UPI0007B04390|nr:tRNA (adenine(22)-N(1))-methyltransferase TrmK [Pseudoalteromonas luteoviolacea]KZN56449.1 hypothetical protein N474_11930 [Pseudoalteromonas luteoviolacea CPMOR-2]